MKLLNYGMAASFLLFTLVAGCKSDSDNSNDAITPATTANCSDGIQNQGEEGVDCGGPCAACPGKFSCKVDGNDWSAHIDSAWLDTGYVGPSFYDYYLFANKGNQTITIRFEGDAQIGTPVPLSNNMSGNFLLNLVQYTSGLNFYPNLSSGSIKFTKIDQVNLKASGTFSFGVSSLGGGSSHYIQQGEFVNITLR